MSTKTHTSITGTSRATLPGMGSLAEVKARTSVAAAPIEETGEKKTWKQKMAEAKAARTLAGGFEAYPHLMAFKPKEGYIFHSDYFQVDSGVGCILGFFHDDGARDSFSAFWGIARIPENLGEGVTTVVLEQTRRMGEKWVEERIRISERLDKLDEQETKDAGASTRRRSAKISDDVDVASAEIQDGAAYLHVHNRLLVKAPDLATLDEAMERISRRYIEKFATLKVAPYPGEQRQELATLWYKNAKKRGRGDHYTSTEYAGSYHLVTNGLNDPNGEYVGYMVGDVNTSAVLFDVDAWRHHVVVGDSTLEPVLNRAHYPDMWGSKISQSALLNNRKVVHIVLDGADLDVLGPRLDSMTARLDMSSGDINMLEMFGEKHEELAIFPAHLDKLVLMTEQAYETTDADRSIIRGALKETLTQFYVDRGMWTRNAKTQRERLRLVDLPHMDVPRLQDLVTYFDTSYASLAASSARDDEMLHAYSVLRTVFHDLLDNQGDLFNTHTADAIDSVGLASRVIYDFSRLVHRGAGVAMAQLVNVVGFAVSNLGLGDVVVIHGTEKIDDQVKSYVKGQFERLYERGGRVAYLYNNVDLMLADAPFSRFEEADYTIMGPVREGTVKQYRTQLEQSLPPDLEAWLTQRGDKISYLRRGRTNVVFRTDLALGVNPARAAQHEAAAAQAAKLGMRENVAARMRAEQARSRDRRSAERAQLADVEPERLERSQGLRLAKTSSRVSGPKGSGKASTTTRTKAPAAGRGLGKTHR